MPVSPAISNWKTKAVQNSMGVAKRMLPPHMVAIQLKILMPVKMPTTMVERTKKALPTQVMPTVNMWCAHTREAHEPDADGGRDHGRIAEDGFAREDRDDLVGNAEGGQHQDIDLGMAEDPEEVHPHDGRAAGLGIEEMRRPDSDRSAA